MVKSWQVVLGVVTAGGAVLLLDKLTSGTWLWEKFGPSPATVARIRTQARASALKEAKEKQEKEKWQREQSLSKYSMTGQGVGEQKW